MQGQAVAKYIYIYIYIVFFFLITLFIITNEPMPGFNSWIQFFFCQTEQKKYMILLISKRFSNQIESAVLTHNW